MTTPQDPSDPQNPYGEPTPPAEPTPPPAEPTPPPAQAPPPPYGEPQPGQPAPPGQFAQPGQYPQPAYGQPAYGQQPPYGQPGFPVGPTGPSEPSKAMAITALVLSFLCCFPIGLILAIVVLVRSRDGRNHGKGLAIGAVIVSIVSAISIGVGTYALTQVDWDSLAPVEQLETGECLNASNLTDESEDFVEDIDEVSCTDPHDAEVLATKELTADEAETYDAGSDMCTQLLESEGVMSKVGPDVSYFGLTSSEEPNAGDKLVCIAYRPDGEKLTAPL
jgi:hypothetical protein